MSRNSTAPGLDAPVSSLSPPSQSLLRSSLQQYKEIVTVSLKVPISSRTVSPKQTFPCQDKNYPRRRSKPTRPIQMAYATSTSDVHWRGDKQSLFMLDPAAKYNIRDYLLEQCKAQKQTTNELKNPTGSKAVFVLQFNDEDQEEEALCVPTNATTLHGIYNFRDAHPAIEKFNPLGKSTNGMQDVTSPRLPRSYGTMSFTRLLASANEAGFPLADRELDSDSDSYSDDEGDRGAAPPAYTMVLDAITEDDENEEIGVGFVDVVDLGAPKYCRDPDSANHPECHGRYKTDSYAHNVVDALLDLQDRFATAHDDRDNAAYYCKWRTLKLDHGETLVHGQSSLRYVVATPQEDDETVDPDVDTEQLLSLIASKYGPLTLEGQRTRPAEAETKCSEEFSFKVDKSLNQEPENYLWLSTRIVTDEKEEVVSEPSTLFHGVADFSDDETLLPAPVPAAPQRRDVPVMSEEELERILNTPHEDFVNGYVQRYEVMRRNAALAKQALEDAALAEINASIVVEASVVGDDNASKKIVELPELIVTAATPASSPIREVTTSVFTVVVDQEITVRSNTDSLPAASVAAPKTTESAYCNVSTPSPTTAHNKAVATSDLPVFIHCGAAPFKNSARPNSASSFCSTCAGSPPPSVFSIQACVSTKPSNESFWSDRLHLIDTTDLQVDVKSPPSSISHHERSVSMPVLSPSASHTNATATDVSESDHSAHARPSYVRPSTPVRGFSAAKKCLTPIIEVQTPLSTSTIPSPTMHCSSGIDDPYESFPPTCNYRPFNNRISPYASYESRDDPVRPIPASVFTDNSSFTSRRARSTKLATFKHRAQAVTSVTKQATRRVLRSMKKLRAAARYFVPATFGSHNPYESWTRS